MLPSRESDKIQGTYAQKDGFQTKRVRAPKQTSPKSERESSKHMICSYNIKAVPAHHLQILDCEFQTESECSRYEGGGGGG